MLFTVSGGNAGAKIDVETIKEQDGLLYLQVKMQMENEAVPQQFSVSWKQPSVDCYSIWSALIRSDRQIGPNWKKKETVSRLANGMPLHTIVSIDDRNRMTVAVSDAITPVLISSGVCEGDACIEWSVDFFTILTAPLKEYSAIIRIDTRDIPYYDSVYDVSAWWEKECGYTPANVPEYARLPMNSLWYSYHQNLDVDDILKECKLSKPLGMDTVIIDDGWQTDDTHGGYAFCGDWEVTKNKIPDMKKFISDIHDTGMKVILWYSVPYIGIYSKNYERFKDMILDETGNRKTYWSLDPRYKEVRDFLVGTYAKAVKEWNLDGLKLDFIDSFRLQGKSLEYDEKRDYVSLEDAVDRLMTDVMKELTALKKDVMIEFRQDYVGPAIRKYGNMLRVGDCPNEAIVNRQDVVNLRLTSGNTPVHSDMLMWHTEDTVESAALQIASVLYAVPQISMKIAGLSDSHKKMLAFYLDFWRTNRDVLLDGKLTASAPESAYSQVCVQKDNRAIITAYTDRIIVVEEGAKTTAVNCSKQKKLMIIGALGRAYTVLDCMGEVVKCGIVEAAAEEIGVPTAGMITVE